MNKITKQILVAIGGIAVILGVVGIHKNTNGEVVFRLRDKAPEINLTWVPEQPIDLREFNAHLRITDDHRIDFTSYRFTIVEAERTLDFPVENLIGREWEQPISLSLISSDEKLIGRDHITLRISVSDDMGQVTQIEKVVNFRK